MEVETPAAGGPAAGGPAAKAKKGKYKEIIIKEEDKGKVQVFKVKHKTDGTSTYLVTLVNMLLLHLVVRS